MAFDKKGVASTRRALHQTRKALHLTCKVMHQTKRAVFPTGLSLLLISGALHPTDRVLLQMRFPVLLTDKPKHSGHPGEFLLRYRVLSGAEALLSVSEVAR